MCSWRFRAAFGVFEPWEKECPQLLPVRDDAHSLWQVDSDLMEAIFSSLVKYLGLGNAYNIFILNPKAGAKRAKYGYRRGLSESEMNLLREWNESSRCEKSRHELGFVY